ncbi:MAG: MBL fold metallo-hydrolase [Acidobacteriota bacterium]
MGDEGALTLTVLGSGTAVPSTRRGPSGFLLHVGHDHLVFDTGPGTMARLLRAGVTHDQVTHLFYSHNHLDHTGELAPFLFTSRIPASARASRLTICGSAGFMRMFSSLLEVYGDWLAATTYPRELVTLDTGGASRLSTDSWSVQAFPVNHIESSLAYRLTHISGKTFVYTGDTDMCDDLLRVADGADLLLIEASMPDGRKIPKHLTPSEAGTIAHRAGARKVILTHFYPPCEDVDMLEQVRDTFTGEALLAEDGLRVEI